MKAFLFDLNRCTGCQACELACMIENRLDDWSWRQVVTLNPARRPGTPVIHLSLACSHCAEAPCMAHCPALAYSQDRLTGRVVLDAERCIGCRYCGWACPYDAPRFDEGAGVMTKCTFCGERQAAGLEPACVEQCPAGALGFGDLATLPGVEEAPGMPTLEPRPSIRFISWARSAPRPSQEQSPVSVTDAEPRSKISLRSEWPLVGFTLITAALVAAFAASALGSLTLPPLPFVAAAALAAGLSSLHLGRKLRAWRAVLNLRRSWLSREIALFSGFVTLATIDLLLAPGPGFAATTALLGLGLLFAVDRVYDLVRTGDARPLHSADVLLTGPLWAGLLIASLPLAGFAALLKLVLYLRRKLRRRNPRGWWSLARVGIGFVLPAAMGLADPTRWPAWALAGTVVGEIIDRCELYGELEVPTPRRQMALDLEGRLTQAA